MYMGRSLHIYIEHRNLEMRKTRNDFSVQVQTFLLPLSLKVFRHKEKGTIFLFWLFHLPPPPLTRVAPWLFHLPSTNTCGTRHKGLREQAKTNRLPPRQVSSLLTDFFKISQNPPRASGEWRHSHCVTPFPISANVTSLSDTSAPRERAWTPPLMLHLSNTCNEPKGSQPN